MIFNQLFWSQSVEYKTCRVAYTLAVKIIEWKCLGEICESHLVASRRIDFAAAILRYALSYSLHIEEHNHSGLTKKLLLQRENGSVEMLMRYEGLLTAYLIMIAL